MKKDPEQFFRELKHDVITYAALKFELVKLGAYERMGKVIAVLSYSLILVMLAFVLTLFIFIALGFFLGDCLHSMSAGFAIVAILYLLVISGVMLFRDQIRTSVLHMVISALLANDNTENNATDKDDADRTAEP